MLSRQPDQTKEKIKMRPRICVNIITQIYANPWTPVSLLVVMGGVPVPEMMPNL